MSNIDERIAGLITVTESHTRMIESHTRMITSLTELSEQNTQAIIRLEQSVETLVNVASNQQATQAQHQQNFNTMIEAINQNSDDVRVMQAEIKGLQTENRRILDQLINPGET